MGFNRDNFITKAKGTGATDKQINDWLTSRGYEGINTTLSSTGGGSQGLTGTAPISSSLSGFQPSTSLSSFNPTQFLQSMGPAMAMTLLQKGDISKAVNLLRDMERSRREWLKEEEILREKRDKKEMIDQAINLLEKKDNQGITGPISGRLSALRIRFSNDLPLLGEPTEEERKLWNTLGTIRMQQLFEIGGKVLPQQEIRELEPFVPSYQLPAEQNIQNLKSLKKKLDNLYSRRDEIFGGIE